MSSLTMDPQHLQFRDIIILRTHMKNNADLFANDNVRSVGRVVEAGDIRFGVVVEREYPSLGLHFLEFMSVVDFCVNIIRPTSGVILWTPNLMYVHSRNQ